jgi:hypothetical protein
LRRSGELAFAAISLGHLRSPAAPPGSLEGWQSCSLVLADLVAMRE